MMLRTRALVSIGIVLIGLALGLGVMADPLVRLTIEEHRELSYGLARIRNGALGPLPPIASEDAAVARLWMVVTLACVVAPLLAAIALRVLFAPVAKLRDACLQPQDQAAARPLDERRSDELGMLCAAFDRMRSRLEQNRRRRLRYHEHLETAVNRKTRQLTATVERLRSLDQMKDAFLACASHELQKPVRAIVGAGDALAEPAAASVQAETVKRMLSDCRRVDQMTRDILDFVRTSSEGFDFRFESTTVETVLRRAIASVLQRKSRDDVEVALVLLEDCTVVWDGSWISRVVESIVERILLRARSGSTVSLESRLQGPDVCIEVRFDRIASTNVPDGDDVDDADHDHDAQFDRTVWNPVVERHLGEWSERESDAHTSIVLVLPALAEHLGWTEESAREPHAPHAPSALIRASG